MIEIGTLSAVIQAGQNLDAAFTPKTGNAKAFKAIVKNMTDEQAENLARCIDQAIFNCKVLAHEEVGIRVDAMLSSKTTR